MREQNVHALLRRGEAEPAVEAIARLVLQATLGTAPL